MPRSGPRNMRVYDPTTTTLTVSWEHAQGPVMQYRITYAQTSGDPIEEYVSMCRIPIISLCLTHSWLLIHGSLSVSLADYGPREPEQRGPAEPGPRHSLRHQSDRYLR